MSFETIEIKMVTVSAKRSIALGPLRLHIHIIFFLASSIHKSMRDSLKCPLIKKKNHLFFSSDFESMFA